MNERFAASGGAAIVTGASRGIGRAIAETLATDGLDVVMCSRSADGIATAADGITAEYGVETVGSECDVRERDGVEDLVATVEETLGGVDVLVNNAGASFVASFEDSSPNGVPDLEEVART